MLELKRRLSQTVRIGTRSLATVIAIDADRAVIRLREFRMAVVIPLRAGEHCECDVDGHKLRIHLRGIERGECLLGFEAPRELPIDRGEALNGS